MKPSFMFSSLLAMAITFFTLNEVTTVAAAAAATSPSLNRIKLSSRDLNISKTIQLLRNYGIIVDVYQNSKGQDEFIFEVDEQQTKYKCEILPANGKGGNGAHGGSNNHSHPHTKDRHSHHHHSNEGNNHHKHHHPHPSKSAGSNTSSSTGIITSKKTDGPASTNTNSDPNNISTGTNTSTTTSTGSKSTPTTSASGDGSTNTNQVTSTTSSSSSSSTTTSNGSQPTTKPIDTSKVCPQGYKGYGLGDRYFINEANLVDLSGLTIDLNILNFGTNNNQVGDETVTPTKDLICESITCCIKPTCPTGYTEASEGDEMILNKSVLIDLSGLNVDLDVLNFGQKDKQTASNGQKCSSSTCCYKPKQTTTTNEDSLIDAKNIDIGLCLLSGTC